MKTLIRKLIRESICEIQAESTPGWSIVAVGFPGTSRQSPSRWAIHRDNSTQYLTKTGEWGSPMEGQTFMSADEAAQFAQQHLSGEVKEITTTGAVAGYMTPVAFKKTKKKKYNEEWWKIKPPLMQSADGGEYRACCVYHGRID